MTKEVQKAIDFIHAYMHPTSDSEYEQRKRKYRDMAIKALEQERPKGEWLPTHEYLATEGGSIDYVKCSCCERWSLEQEALDFCPYCGADMRGGKE